jgi:hypothetical protein
VGSGNVDSTAAPCLEFCAYLSRLGRADERTPTAYPCSSYEFACARSSPSWCVRKLRSSRRFSTIRGSSFVHCVPVRINTVAVRSQASIPRGTEWSRGVGCSYLLLRIGHSSLTLTPFVANTVLIASAHAGSASRRSTPSATRTSTINLLICSACSRGWALTRKPSLLSSDFFQYLLPSYASFVGV